MSTVYAVLFDVDGVLVDSYKAHLESWRVAGEDFGAVITPEQFAKSFGRTSREIIKELWPGRFSDEQVARFDEAKEAAFRAILEKQYPEMPGAAELMQSLHEAGFRIALGSSGPKENVALARRKLSKARLIQGSIDGSQVANGKPHPEVFLRAAELVHARPQDCAVIEDAPAGLEAARRAGMARIALTGTASREVLAPLADLVVDSLAQLSPKVICERIEKRSGTTDQKVH